MNISRLYHTIKYLKPIQIKYQIWYRLRKVIRSKTGFKYPLLVEKEGTSLNLFPCIAKYTSYENGKFSFLNLEKDFNGEIDWNYSDYGKLWIYNLNYFDFLLQEDMEAELGYQLIDDYISKLNQKSEGLEPYPTSLRCINWIKFLVFTQRSPRNIAAFAAIKKIDASIYAQYQILLDNLEYHLLANHLLENAFSLLFGAFYFKDQKLYNKAYTLLFKELEEQILHDGAHFELSPMYHQIILDRLLDSINLCKHNKVFDKQGVLEKFLIEISQIMMSWLNQMTYGNNEIPLFNDSTTGVSATTSELRKYFSNLKIPKIDEISLGVSGYRKLSNQSMEAYVNCAEIHPTYQPGHAHADTGEIVLNINDKPIIVDPGISTYESNNTRSRERSTSFHNTISINGQNSSDVWSSFRVGKRVKINNISENQEVVKLDYVDRSRNHIKRNIVLNNDSFIVEDFTNTDNCCGYLHFADDLNVSIDGNVVNVYGYCKIEFPQKVTLKSQKYKLPLGYNRYVEAIKLEYIFSRESNFKITIE